MLLQLTNQIPHLSPRAGLFDFWRAFAGSARYRLVKEGVIVDSQRFFKMIGDTYSNVDSSTLEHRWSPIVRKSAHKKHRVTHRSLAPGLLAKNG